MKCADVYQWSTLCIYTYIYVCTHPYTCIRAHPYIFICVCICVHEIRTCFPVEYERLVKDELYSTDDLYAKDVIDVLEKLKACVKCLQVMSVCVCVCVCVWPALNASRSYFLKSQMYITGWQRCRGCFKLQVSFRKRATNYRALLRKNDL